MSKKQTTTGADLTNELLQALLMASVDQKQMAICALRGENCENQETVATEPYLTLREIGRRLNISPCSLWRWQVPGHELGGRRRFRMSEVLAYLESSAFRELADELKRQRRSKAADSRE
jgi:hypothetical protein